MAKKERIILALGSNFNQRQNIELAKEKLLSILGEGTEFSHTVWTKPIGMKSENFLNCVCFAYSGHTFAQLTRAFKQIERRLDRTRKNEITGKIPIDIDILQYGETRHHEEDWKRDYIKEIIEDYELYKDDGLD